MIKEVIKIPPYDQIPKVRKEIEEIENLIETRLSLIDQLDAKIHNSKNYSECNLISILNEKEDILGWKNNHEEDIISHYFLSLAFSKNESLKNWYFIIYIYLRFNYILKRKY